YNRRKESKDNKLLICIIIAAIFTSLVAKEESQAQQICIITYGIMPLEERLKVFQASLLQFLLTLVNGFLIKQSKPNSRTDLEKPLISLLYSYLENQRP